ncbi:1-deoxy-D-xylulose-5-phosphate reductoisomerase [Denitrificimonas sp. JX-1]|uniref:1-deoxy-D-xylulose 5-phosphate reductoisomerase n=1 Tax=Denitrificimonas halotolerans TaxID=3098930 RepID=A0ABU5GPQ8_9GAMM|nr:1-deoxy-D-xylulose-5-phosphate reductoisomerase [Denitrificimonas sp. JX-1]MDY7218710.1 1-deoxy-D-xylulose-5-phosphate reductoisomerase [Denitrificimonas sp. JX-1]
MQPQQVTVLGATGSIGSSTLDVISQHPQRYQVFALTAHSRISELQALCVRFQPRFAVVAEAAKAQRLQADLQVAGVATRVLVGPQGLCEVAAHPDVDTVMAAIVGAAGLESVMAAVTAGKKILLANKEALVMSGALFMSAVREHKAQLLPIDSEHNAIFQCLPCNYAEGLEPVGVRRILLTASGGPFRNSSYQTLEQVTPEQACAHPNWSMGQKISVDSATMMNKGLELIEACWLFAARPDQVEVVVHPQSVIHSLVDYVDGSVLAQLGNPDMRTPIAHAMAWPERIDSGVAPLDLCALARMDFVAPDLERFACLRLAIEAAKLGGTAPIALNAANEVAVAAFLQNRLRFTQIPQLIEKVLSLSRVSTVNDLAGVFEIDREARQQAQAWLNKQSISVGVIG